jgi:hypothetical protein
MNEHESFNDVGQTSGLPVQGVSDALNWPRSNPECAF